MEFVNCFSSHIVCSAEKPTSVVGRRHGRKKRGSNPYAERGLDRFAVLSAELEAKRKKLVSQLGTPLSFVRFAIGSDHRNWIPVIVCPTLSKAEIRTLERTATRLIAEDTDAFGSAPAGAHTHARAAIRESQAQDRGSLTRDEASGHDRKQLPARVSVVHADDAQNGTLNYLLSASEKGLWMLAFAFSVAADMVSNVFLSKWHGAAAEAEAPPQRTLPSSTRKRKQDSENPSSNATSPMNLPSLPRIRTPASISAKHIKLITPSHPSTAHAGVPKTHQRHENAGFSTAPSTPRDSRQAKKAFQASVSFPTKTRLQDEAPRSAGTTKNSTILKSLSLPKVSPRAKEHGVRRSATSKAKEEVRRRKSRETSEKWGQVLTGAWVTLGLGGLVMGYIPAIICVVCWWYALPSLRKAVGDKPHVKSHHR